MTKALMKQDDVRREWHRHGSENDNLYLLELEYDRRIVEFTACVAIILLLLFWTALVIYWDDRIKAEVLERLETCIWLL